MTALDEISKIVLGNIKLPSENAKIIIPFLKKIRQDYGNPIAIVHDMGNGILSAVKDVFPTVLDFICHFHFLRDIGKDLFGLEYTLIRRSLKNHRIRPSLRKCVKKMKQLIDQDTSLLHCLKECQKSHKLDKFSLKMEPTVTAYVLALWALDANSELNGYGFPFDREHFVFYQRLEAVSSSLDNLKNVATKNTALSELRKTLSPVVRDRELKNITVRMKEKVKIFDKLREAMKIALPDAKDGLKDDGADIDMATIKDKVTAFRESEKVISAASTNVAYKKMMKQIDKYWEKLFADPITIYTSSGSVTIQPQRTNNILERFFRDMKRRNRKKSGTNKLTRTLKAMIADSPLVQNLENQEYMRVLLNGKKSLAERFAEINAQLVRKEMKEKQNTPEDIPPELKKVLRIPTFPTKIVKSTRRKWAA